MTNSIRCPHCGKQIEISEALRHDVEEKVKLNLEDKIRKEFREKGSTELEDLKRQLKENLNTIWPQWRIPWLG